jgi:hypothetical protein
LGIGRAATSRFFLGSLPALIFHLAAIEAHGSMVDCCTVLSIQQLPPRSLGKLRLCGGLMQIKDL